MKLTPVIPFEPVSTDDLPAGSGWVAQVKWDGVRVLTYYDGSEVRLFNRKLNERTLQYPELTAVHRYCRAASVILDGEIIAFDNGKVSFQEVMKRDSLRSGRSVSAALRQVPVTYMIFDVLYCNGEWVTDKPLKQRQEMLDAVIVPQNDVQIVQNHTDLATFYQVTEKHGLEGIVCKDIHSSYVIDGKDGRWKKKKHYKDLYAVIGGVIIKHGAVHSILLGLYDERERLIYIGHTGTGKLKRNEGQELARHLKPWITDKMPFVNRPDRYEDAVWVKPHLTVKVKYIEKTLNHTLRQPSLQGFTKLPPRECTLNQLN